MLTILDADDAQLLQGYYRSTREYYNSTAGVLTKLESIAGVLHEYYKVLKKCYRSTRQYNRMTTGVLESTGGVLHCSPALYSSNFAL